MASSSVLLRRRALHRLGYGNSADDAPYGGDTPFHIKKDLVSDICIGHRGTFFKALPYWWTEVTAHGAGQSDSTLGRPSIVHSPGEAAAASAQMRYSPFGCMIFTWKTPYENSAFRFVCSLTVGLSTLAS
jgi:hypothetical protein